jgi:hypothetical protein
MAACIFPPWPQLLPYHMLLLKCDSDTSSIMKSDLYPPSLQFGQTCHCGRNDAMGLLRLAYEKGYRSHLVLLGLLLLETGHHLSRKPLRPSAHSLSQATCHMSASSWKRLIQPPVANAAWGRLAVPVESCSDSRSVNRRNKCFQLQSFWGGLLCSNG